MRVATEADCLRACEMMEQEGWPIIRCARELGCDYPSLSTALRQSAQYSARAIEARINGAEALEELALRALRDIPDDAPKGQITRQRELAQMYLRLARVRDPRRYGEKVQVGGADDLPPVQTETSIVALDFEAVRAKRAQ